MLRSVHYIVLLPTSASFFQQIGLASGCSVSRSLSSANTPEGGASSSAASPAQPQNATQEDAPSSSLAKLRKASPTGKLLDLFAVPSSTGGDRSGLAATADATTSAAVAAAQAMQQLQARDVVQIILQAVENCKPLMKVTGVKSGTKLLYIPKVVTPPESRSLAIRWIIEATNKRRMTSKGAKMADCLALELLLAFKKEGTARQKRDDLHKLALENKSNVGGGLRAGRK